VIFENIGKTVEIIGKTVASLLKRDSLFFG